MKTAYTFDDIILVPQFSTLRSRLEADTSYKFWKYERTVPIISSNMETITGSEVANKIWELGGIGALHRFWTIEENVEAYNKVQEQGNECLVSVGVNKGERERACALFKTGARMFVIDIAHGHSILMKEMLEWMKDKWGEEVFIMAGNVATGKAAEDLCKWGADYIKSGVGSGAICTTRIVSGHGFPSFSSLEEVCYASTKPVVADGGIKSSGDMVKSFVAGASCVMIGSLIAGTHETPGETWTRNGRTFKLYKGSSSYEKGPKIAKEGIETEVLYKGRIKSIINELTAGIRSGMSYSNAHNYDELRENAKYVIQTPNGYLEGLPHIKGHK